MYDFVIKCTHNNPFIVYCRTCGLADPSWSEVANFVKFFNIQLLDFEKSGFIIEGEDLFTGFRDFVLKFLLQMSKVCVVAIKKAGNFPFILFILKNNIVYQCFFLEVLHSVLETFTLSVLLSSITKI